MNSKQKFSTELPKLIIIRGIPGSGKDTVANFLSRNFRYQSLSPDDHLNWKKKAPSGDAIKAAKQKCLKAVKASLKQGRVVVHHNFTFLHEIKDFIDLLPKKDILVVRVITIFTTNKPCSSRKYAYLRENFEYHEREEHVFFQETEDELYFLEAN